MMIISRRKERERGFKFSRREESERERGFKLDWRGEGRD